MRTHRPASKVSRPSPLPATRGDAPALSLHELRERTLMTHALVKLLRERIAALSFDPPADPALTALATVCEDAAANARDLARAMHEQNAPRQAP